MHNSRVHKAFASLPPAWIAAFSLDEGRIVPALSLYLDVNPAEPMRIESCVSRLERIRIATNLRHDELAHAATESALTSPAPGLPFGAELSTLWRLAKDRGT